MGRGWRTGTLGAAMLLIIASGASAQERSVGQGIQQPLRDARLKQQKVPEALLIAESAPYSNRGMESCASIAAEVRRLDEALGPDADTPSTHRGGGAAIAATASGSVVGAIIPGFGLLKYVTGADKAERRAQAAVYAGAVRRGYLKGLGLARSCPVPARPTPTAVAAEPDMPEATGK